MEPRRLVLMVEGEGDVAATRVMVRRLLTEIDGWKHLFLDKNVFRVGGIERITGRKHSEWQRYLSLATKRKDLAESFCCWMAMPIMCMAMIRRTSDWTFVR